MGMSFSRWLQRWLGNIQCRDIGIYYALEHLHAHHVVVMGHYGCGGVAAAIASPPSEPISEADQEIQEWIKPIRDIYASSDR